MSDVFHLLSAMDRKLDRILRTLSTITKNEEAMANELDDLKSQVAAQTTVEGSAITLLNGISARIDAAIAAGGKPQDFVDMRDQLKASADGLAAAVTANTPAVPPPQQQRRQP